MAERYWDLELAGFDFLVVVVGGLGYWSFQGSRVWDSVENFRGLVGWANCILCLWGTNFVVKTFFIKKIVR